MRPGYSMLLTVPPAPTGLNACPLQPNSTTSTTCILRPFFASGEVTCALNDIPSISDVFSFAAVFLTAISNPKV